VPREMTSRGYSTALELAALFLQECRHGHVECLSEVEESFVEQSPPPALHIDENVA